MDTALAYRLMMTARHRTLHDELYVWDGVRYCRKSDPQALREIFRLTSSDEDPSVRKLGDALQKVKILTGLDSSVPPPFWVDESDEKNPLPEGSRDCTPIPFRNGTLLLEWWLEGRPDCFIPSHPDLFAIATAPYAYDPAATCPRWMDFLDWFLRGDQSRIEMIQQFLGSAYVRNRNPERLLWLQGAGSNGKSVFAKVLEQVVGSDQVGHLNVSDLNRDFHLANLLGKRLNISLEFNDVTSAVEEAIKRLVSNEQQAVNRKFKSVVDQRLFCKLMLVSNSVPFIKDYSDGFWRRVLLVRCQAQPAQRRLNFEEELIQESAGIFNWILDGAGEFLQSQNIEVPELVAADIRDIRDDYDMIGRFVRESFVYTGLQSDEIVVSTPKPAFGAVNKERVSAYRQFESWCEEHGHKQLPNSATFVRRVTELTGCIKARVMKDGDRRIRFQGLAWRDEVIDDVQSGRRSLESLPETELKRELRQPELTRQREETIRRHEEAIRQTEAAARERQQKQEAEEVERKRRHERQLLLSDVNVLLAGMNRSATDLQMEQFAEDLLQIRGQFPDMAPPETPDRLQFLWHQRRVTFPAELAEKYPDLPERQRELLLASDLSIDAVPRWLEECRRKEEEKRQEAKKQQEKEWKALLKDARRLYPGITGDQLQAKAAELGRMRQKCREQEVQQMQQVQDAEVQPLIDKMDD